MALGTTLDQFWGGQKTPEGMVNSQVGGATHGAATYNQQKQDASTNQSGIVDVSANTPPTVSTNQQPASTSNTNGAITSATTSGVVVPQNNVLDVTDLSMGESTAKNPFENDSAYKQSQAIKDALAVNSGGVSGIPAMPVGIDGDTMLVKIVEQSKPALSSNMIEARRNVDVGKPSNSGIGISPDFLISFSQLNQASQLISKYLPLVDSQSAQQIGNEMSTYIQMMADANNKGDANAYLDTLAKRKSRLGAMATTVANAVYASKSKGNLSLDADADYMSLYDLKDKSDMFNWYYQKSGQEIHNYINDAEKTVVSQEKVVNPAVYPSRRAKNELKQNKFYLNYLEQIKTRSPSIYYKLVSDLDKPNLSEDEKTVLGYYITNVVSPYYNQKKTYATQYGRDYANKTFSPFDEMFKLFGLNKKNLWDDMMDELKTSMFGNNTSTSSLFDNQYDGILDSMDYSSLDSATSYTGYSKSSSSTSTTYRPASIYDSSFGGLG